MVEGRKHAVSIRMNSADVRKVKKLAQRLGVRDSDVIRFAVKGMLARLGPLHDAEVRGRNLVPVFVESGVELLRFFELDAVRLEAIINEGVEGSRRVDRDDIALLALSGAQERYAALKLSELRPHESPGSATTHATETGHHDSDELANSLRQYLYRKYLYRANGEARAPLSANTTDLALSVAAGGSHD